jgi:hypothetical protein
MIRPILFAAATVLAAGEAQASLSARQWYEGMFTCKIANSPDIYKAYITTQQGELGGWGHISTKTAKRSPASYLQRRGDTVSFHVDSNPRAYVELKRYQNVYSAIMPGKLVMKGKSYTLNCTRQ